MKKETNHGRKAPAPLSLRLTPEERRQLERDAGGHPLSAYIRHRLFSSPAPSSAPLGTDTARISPGERQRQLAQILSRLGGCGIGRALLELADAARIGILPLTPDVLAELRSALRDIADLRADLLRALGLKPQERTFHDPER
ncbi:hypothetical protein [Bosea caraganae]|uniref:hypothetical protein n=1 Tax=Bosea caraganae TaxID=2763117 RepID=UPI0011C07B26|nr:hypothetical protein [Bosea caraganae]